jgi:hypothetical protein
MPERNLSDSNRSGRRRTSRVVNTKPGCAPLKAAYEQAEVLKPRTWGAVREIFMRGMEGFDRNVATGVADMGDLQNGKGDFFNDLLALILEKCAEVELYSRGGVPGLIFPQHNLDVTYPSTGAIEFVLEAKAVGTPRHPGSPRQRPIGRAGSADLDKRVKEIGFKTIDLKAEYARILAGRGESSNVIAGDLTSWLHSVRPRSYVFFAARVVNDKDRERVVRFADLAALVSDAVGLFCYRPVSNDEPTRYRAEAVPAHLELDRVLFRACQDLKALRASAPVIAATPSPAAEAESVRLDPEDSSAE